MKKILLLVFALILTGSCTAPSTNEPAKPANPTAEKKAPPPATQADAETNEKAIWDALKAKDYDAFNKMLADDQIEVAGEGVNDKAASTAMVKDFEPTEVTFSDWKFLSIDKDSYLVVYTANVKAKYKGKDLPPGSGRASSVWVNRDGKWLAVFHQECAVKPAQPMAKTAPKATASPAAATAATAPPAAGADPIANEKIVWDLFKAKNYDGFGSLLDASFLEVEPDKVYDKAESVKAVAEFDANKSELSDWKSLKVDDDVAVVTYVVKMQGMPGDGERHSSVWAKRDGKWVAVLHHGGTTIMKPAQAAASPKEATKIPAKP
jgi:hypothetical protein